MPQWVRNVRWCAYCSAGVLLLNIIFASTLAGLAGRNSNHPNHSTENFLSFFAVYSGSCSLVKGWSMALDLLINFFSTVALAASSYCMQILVAPTREDVDKCHARRGWLDIGIPGIKNLSIVGPYRAGLWLILLLTSTPLHLLYNSGVSKAMTLNRNSPAALFIPYDTDLQHFSRLITPRVEPCIQGSDTELDWHEIGSFLANGSYQTVDKEKCLSLFTDQNTNQLLTVLFRSTELNSSMGGNHAIRLGYQYPFQIVSTSPDPNEAPIGYQVNGLWEFSFDSSYGPMSWTTSYLSFDWDTCNQYLKAESCNDAQNLISWLKTALPDTPDQIDNYVKTLSSNATVKPEILGRCQGQGPESKLDFKDCLVIQLPPICELQYSPFIFLLVIVTMTVKVIILFLIIRQGPSCPNLLLTLGDAVASFLTHPDPTTLDMCWMSKFDLNQRKCDWRVNDHVIPKGRLRRPSIWIRAAKLWRKLAVLVLWAVCIIYGAYRLSAYGHKTCYERPNCSALEYWWEDGFDTSTSISTVFDVWRSEPVHLSMIQLALISNLPQLFLTVSYHFYNSVLTSILAEAEYSSYGAKKKGLRVSWPYQNSAQRSTYWLSVPFRYSVPLLIIYLVISWTTSQSLFLMTESSTDKDGYYLDTTLRFSPLAIFVSLILFFVMGIGLLTLGLSRRFKSRLPLTGACSVIISAACHPPIPGDDALHEVQWGETSLPEGLSYEFGVGHCSFTSNEVVEPCGDKHYR